MLPKISLIKYFIEFTDESGNRVQLSKEEIVPGGTPFAEASEIKIGKSLFCEKGAFDSLDVLENDWGGSEKRKDQIQKIASFFNCPDDTDDDEIEDALSCIVTLSERELDLVEAAIGSGYISQSWLKKHFALEDSEIKLMIEHLMKLGIVKKASSTIYKFVFTYDVFKKARKRL